jgi:CHASE3 domain sensor protein
MNNNPLNTQNNTAKAKSIRTFLQSVAAAIVAYLYGLWQLPGVSDYTNEFIKTQGFELLVGLAVLVGLPAAAIAYLQNRRTKV